MKEGMDKRLAFIILDIVAIIAILGIVLLADLADQKERTTFQKMILGGVVEPIPGDACEAIKCDGGDAKNILVADVGYSICECPNKQKYMIAQVT